ncbi:MAG: TIGR04076 family protein [Bacteroidales bacterium]|nr:TIGR04076 family protein [Bacteroidales bacterium]
MDFIVKVKEVKGFCPVYKTDDKFTLKEGYKLVADIPVCMHSLASILPYYNALRKMSPADLGIAGKEDKDKAFVQCLDPLCYTGGGTVVFEITKIPTSR